MPGIWSGRVKITWSEQARKDIRAIHDYIARDSAFYANRMVERLVLRVGGLQQQPRKGHHVHEYPEHPDLREVHEASYRIIYLTAGNEIIIVTIVHFARQFKWSRG